MYVKLSTSDRDYFLPFFDIFCAEVHPVRRQKSHQVYNVGITNDVNVNLMSKTYEVRLLGLNLGLSRDVCEPTIGSVVKDSWWTNQERAVLPSFPKKHTSCNGFILMHCRCQIIHVALRKSIHFREIFEWAFTDGVTTFVNMRLCCRQALIFWPINFYYFTVWCLL